MNLKSYFADRRAVFQELERNFPEGHLYLVSIGNPHSGAIGGRVSLMNLDNAARCLVEGTHEHATEAQVAGFQALQKRNLEEAQSAQFRNSRPTVLNAKKDGVCL